MRDAAGGVASVRKLDHVGIAVDDAREAANFLVQVLGGQFLNGGDNDDTGARLLHFAVGGFKIELMQPLRPTAALARSIAARGTGLHHVTFMVNDVLQTQDALQVLGYETTGTEADSPNWSQTFLRPSQTFGALMQFVSSVRSWDAAAEAFGLDDVLDGRVVWVDHVACLRPSV